VLGAGVVAAGVAAVSFAASVSGSDATNPARLATFAAIALVPLAFLAVLLRIRLAQAAIGRLVVDLSGAPAPGRLREAIARALGDPSLELVYWSRGGNCYVDAHGRRVELPQGGGRAATVVEREGRHVGALVHDPSLVEQRALVDGVVAAAGLALENERLTAELRERLAELRESEERLRALIDASPIAIIELDLDGNVVLWNDAAERLFGWTREEVLGRPYPSVPEEIGVETEEVWSRVFGGEAVVVETVRRRKDGSLADVELTSAPIRDAGGAVIGMMGILADVAERRRAQDELRRERDFTTALIDSAPALIVVLDREGRFVRFNRACEQLTGYSRDEVIGRPFWELFIQREDAPPIREALARVWSGDYPADNENYWVLRDGSRRLIAWSNTALTDAEGNVEFIVSSGLDITDRKRIEEELRASRARIVEAADAARRKLERNLHDGAQQRLVALSLALRMAQAQVAKSPEAAEAMLVSASEELSQALEDLRELARGIHPAVLIDRGLPAALDALATRSPVPVEVRVELEERLPSPVEVAAYYVVSEALANVAKYAQASAVSVSVARENGVALVQVADDGVGGADPARGSGLRGIADRVEALDGRLELTSVPGAGTRLCVRIPVRDEPVRS
jgi:PAS domain S-box-containing protein